MKNFKNIHLAFGGKAYDQAPISVGEQADIDLDAAEAAIGLACLVSVSNLVFPSDSIAGRFCSGAQALLTLFGAACATTAFVGYYEHFSAAQSGSKGGCL